SRLPRPPKPPSRARAAAPSSAPAAWLRPAPHRQQPPPHLPRTQATPKSPSPRAAGAPAPRNTPPAGNTSSPTAATACPSRTNRRRTPGTPAPAATPTGPHQVQATRAPGRPAAPHRAASRAAHTPPGSPTTVGLSAAKGLTSQIKGPNPQTQRKPSAGSKTKSWTTSPPGRPESAKRDPPWRSRVSSSRTSSAASARARKTYRKIHSELPPTTPSRMGKVAAEEEQNPRNREAKEQAQCPSQT